MKHKLKKALSALLCVAIVLTMMPVIQQAEAAVTDVADSYITMPITIRDFAADGMLFEFNQVGATGTKSTGNSYSYYALNPSDASANEYKGIRIYTSGNAAYKGTYWHCIICQKDGTVVKVLADGVDKSNYANYVPSGGYSVWAWDGDSTAYNAISVVTEANKSNYTVTYNTTNKTITIATAGSGATYNQADTAGFSLLATSDADHINNLTDSASIAGTTLLQNGSWGLTTDPTPITATLNSGATQQVYGAWIRTDLVEAELDENGKMVYTKAAVDYLANYMQQIMAVPEQNSDGSYNTYFVTGEELTDLGSETLAAKIRTQVTGGLGTYAAAKAKYDAGNLSVYTDIKTWYDAAYFLLHNTFTDSTGYGKTVNNYDSLHLVQTTNADGEVCYVFNSKYDDTKYDYDNGEIYNTQTTDYTIAKSASNNNAYTYVRGNPLPDARFDPLGLSGAGVELGYGISDDTYGDMIAASTADWNTYYDTTNYHLSLEGHAQFIYYEDSDLYFTFTGDDDVYLFINGVRVLDVGAAHSISKVKINLNDVAALCGLSDGKAYDFDFYYMERHGTAANFGIETNIKIVDPAMTTTKEGFQNQISTGYNGYVDPLAPVYYSFGLQNNGEAPIEDLTFQDDTIGVYLSKDTITLNTETQDYRQYLGAIVYNADGTTKSQTDGITDDALKALLAGQLAVGEKIIVYGFRYTIPDTVWNADGTFPNTVYTTAVGVGDNAGKQLNGMADWKVQKRQYNFQDYHVYEWVGRGVTLTKDELLQPLVDAVTGFTKDDATIAVSSASGATTGVNVNTKAVLNSDGSITYTGTQTGADTFYYKVTEGSVTAVIGVAVYSYDVADNTYVLDYGLSVELNGADFGLMVNDTLTLSDNPNATTAKVTDIQDATSNYGDFTWADPSLKYTPKDIIDNTDSVRANVQVLEDGATELTKFTGVAMYETVTTAPASVVYYEENFPGITYVSSDENKWVHYETVDPETGETLAGNEQSADQDSNYGSDPNYEEDKVGTIVSGDSVGTVVDSFTMNLDTSDLDAVQASGIEYLNEYLGLGGSDSNGTVNELVVKETAEVMFFEFVGTGFEIISRTTDGAYAVIDVQVQRKNEDGTYTVVRYQPVITESKGGDLYQVPIISITGLEKAEYRVTVTAAGNATKLNRVLYIDGIRIYGPLSDDEALEYYNPEEYQAEFFEIKQMIQDGKMIYADASDTDDDLQLVTGTTLVEDQDANGVLTSIIGVDGYNSYMTIGPNNEIYLDPDMTSGMIAFFLTPIEKDENGNDYPDGARTLEIGAHRKSDSMYEYNGKVTLTYGSTAQDILDGTNYYSIASGTEMYYTIDVSKLTLDENGKYLVMIGANVSENIAEVLALTNIKIAGYEISFAEAAVQTASVEGNLHTTPIVTEPFAVLTARLAVVEEEEPEVVTIPVNENLTINSAALRAASVVSGKTAILNVQASSEATTIVVTDAEGNVVEATRVTTKVDGDIVRFNFVWKVTGSRGDVLDYTVRVYDTNGLASVNEETVTVTIK